jgi:hypothetical protein
MAPLPALLHRVHLPTWVWATRLTRLQVRAVTGCGPVEPDVGARLHMGDLAVGLGPGRPRAPGGSLRPGACAVGPARCPEAWPGRVAASIDSIGASARGDQRDLTCRRRCDDHERPPSKPKITDSVRHSGLSRELSCRNCRQDDAELLARNGVERSCRAGGSSRSADARLVGSLPRQRPRPRVRRPGGRGRRRWRSGRR